MISKSIFRSKCIIFFADSSIAGAWGKSVKSSTELREPLFCCVRRQTGGRLSNCPKWLKLKCVKQLRTLVIHFHLPNLLSPLHTSVTGSFKIDGMKIPKLVCFLRTQLICTRSTCIMLRPWGPPWMGTMRAASMFIHGHARWWGDFSTTGDRSCKRWNKQASGQRVHFALICRSSIWAWCTQA